MRRIVILDAGPLGMAAQAPDKAEAKRCLAWIASLKQKSMEIAVPEIARYELRRELVRIGAVAGLRRLDHLQGQSTYLPLNSEVMDRAGDLWAYVRRVGRPTASDPALDGDAILAAQALEAAETGDEVIVATTNVAHLARFPGVDARLWWTVS